VLAADQTGHPYVRTNSAGKAFARYEVRALTISAMGTPPYKGMSSDTAAAEQPER
jgi:hypothetical protein